MRPPGQPPDVPDVPEREDDPLWKRRVVRTEINRRRVNEALDRGRSTTAPAPFMCECGRIGCNETLTLSTADYEAVRSGFERFLLIPGHEISEVDSIVERREGYLVVAKQGDGARAAERTDPRTKP